MNRGQVKVKHRILYVFSNFNYSVAVKINVSNSYCLKQEGQAVLLMLILADKLKFFFVASFKLTCCKHLITT